MKSKSLLYSIYILRLKREIYAQLVYPNQQRTDDGPEQLVCNASFVTPMLHIPQLIRKTQQLLLKNEVQQPKEQLLTKLKSLCRISAAQRK
jgi:hypothetical protein